jgi:hypothetical protein
VRPVFPLARLRERGTKGVRANKQVHYFPMRAAVPETHEPIAQQLVQARRHLIDALFATDAPIEAWMRQYATALDNTLRALYQRAWAQASQEVPRPRNARWRCLLQAATAGANSPPSRTST